MKQSIDLTAVEDLQGNWNYPTQILFGAGRVDELGTACATLNITRPLLVTDSGLATHEMVTSLLDSNRQAGFPIELFSNVKPNPTENNVEDGVNAYHRGCHDGVIAMGGGSALDAGKAIALMAGQHNSLWDFEDVGDNWRQANTAGIAPVIAIPTTSGTGSEVGRASVIVDETSQTKKIIFHPKMMPTIVIADPGLTQGLPPLVTAATGLDAFVHNLEAFCAPGYNPMLDAIAVEAMRLIRTWLPPAYNNGSDLVARSHMMAASTMGATAFQKGLGGIHALAHPLGAIYDKHHGLLNAILLPYVLQVNRPVIEERIAHAADCMGLETPGFDSFLGWVLTLRQTLNIPHTLKEIGITPESSAKIGMLALKDPSAGGNPIALTAAQYSGIFETAVNGK